MKEQKMDANGLRANDPIGTVAGDERFKITRGLTPNQIFDCENHVEPQQIIAERIANKVGAHPTDPLVDDIAHAIKDAREIGAKRAAVGYEARIAELEAQLFAEGEHTAAANANIDRLNTEIERVTRRQQGDLMGED